MNSHKRGFSIGSKAYLFILLTVLTAVLGTAAISYMGTVEEIDDFYNNITLSSAKNYASTLDSEFMSSLREVVESGEYQEVCKKAAADNDDAPVEEYLRNAGLWEQYSESRDMLDEFLKNTDRIKYLYVIASYPDEKRYMYLLGSNDFPAYATGSFESVGEEFENLDPIKGIEPTISRSEWGWLCSAFVPVYAKDGSVVCVVGCDVSMDDVMGERARFFATAVVGALLFTAFILVIAMLLINKLIVSPLNVITERMKNFRPMENVSYEEAGVIDLDLKRNDEIQDIYNGIRTMQTDIIDYLNYVVSAKEAEAVAEEASRAKSTFLANMSHEIRNPINAVLGMNEMILRESTEENVLVYADNIRAAGFSLLGIINDILDLSKIEAGKMEIMPVDYNSAYLINDLVNMIDIRVEEKGLGLLFEIDSEIPQILHGDDVRIKQIASNLLTNAVKYTEKGSITLSVSAEKIPDEADIIMLKVSVKDTGIGIRPEDMKKLFTEYERIDEEKNRNVEGTGLGMNITMQLLKMMGSSLEVESTYGEGSEFSFRIRQKVVKWLPIGDYENIYRQSFAIRNRYKEKFTAPDAAILMVDDNEMNLTVFKSLLKRTLIQIDTATDGKEALELSRKKKYDIIFLDHLMPELDGVQTLKEIREEQDNPNINTPVICLTANVISGSREKYISAGFDDYLTKPINSDLLENMILENLKGKGPMASG